jgi:RP/EB family microtubule-associated protein
VAYSQVIDAIHPGSINLSKLNLNTKYPEDNYRNIKLIEDALKRLKISQPLSFEKISKGKFHDNIVLLQWLYGYANRNGLENLEAYRPYEKRLQILERQNKSVNEMSMHLKPNEAYYEEQDWEAGV